MSFFGLGSSISRLLSYHRLLLKNQGDVGNLDVMGNKYAGNMSGMPILKSCKQLSFWCFALFVSLCIIIIAIMASVGSICLLIGYVCARGRC